MDVGCTLNLVYLPQPVGRFVLILCLKFYFSMISLCRIS